MLLSPSTHAYTHSPATADFAFTDEAAVQKVLELYPDDPSQGVPVNTGDGVLPTGFQDKRVSIFFPLSNEYIDIFHQSAAFFGDAVMVGPRRAFAQAMSKSQDVFSYRFNQPPFHFSITTGGTVINHG